MGFGELKKQEFRKNLRAKERKIELSRLNSLLTMRNRWILDEEYQILVRTDRVRVKTKGRWENYSYRKVDFPDKKAYVLSMTS